MIHHSQFMSNISPSNRPQQQSSPSENSMSTATPPHQISRASPASTALVMSSNNIHQQPTSRQLTPNTNSSTGSNHHQQHSNNNSGGGSSSTSSTTTSNAGPPPHIVVGPPNPMVRQFACHGKSMSAGVVVSVPGISNNLATATGMNQNNIINNNIISNNNHQKIQAHGQQVGHHVHHGIRAHQQQIQQQQHQIQQQQQQQHHQQQQHQQVIREHHQLRNHHHQQASQPVPMAHQQHQYNPNGGIQNLARQTTSSSIILSTQNINSIHNRSASTHLSNVLLGPQNTHSSNHHRGSTNNYPSHVTNSIWSIDENVSKSQGKLTTSGYIPHPYLFNTSITDMSCDNVSNASRFIDGAAAPGYYLHASSNLPNSNGLPTSGSIKTSEFLPICDLMFNFISMIIYFCENTFNIIALIALYYHTTYKHWALVGSSFVVASIFCQYLSFKWLYGAKLEDCRRKREAQEELENEEGCERRYYNRMAANMRSYPCGSCTWLPDSTTEVQLKFILSVVIDAILHIFCLGFLWRYIKLVLPVTDTARVKKEARDLCMLRVIHGFVQSAPLLLLQAYMICSQTVPTPIINLSVTSAILSLINVCWALASFTKYARKKYMHKFVLTWLGIVCQFLWRLGTVSSRVVALTIYGFYYGHWMLVVLFLHWLVMFLWFVTPGNLFKDEVNLPKAKKLSLAMAVAWVHCFCYVNFEEHNSKLKMVTYYLIMFLSNNLLLTLCLIFSAQVTWFKNLSIMVVYLGFALGMLFMFLYYKYFHVTVLNHGCSQESVDSIADQLSPAGKKIAGFKPGTLRLKSEDSPTSGHQYSSNINSTLHTGSQPEITRNIKPPYLSTNQAPLPQSGVFNCKLNTGLKYKMPQSHSHRHNT